MYKKTVGMRLLAYIIDWIFIFLLGILMYFLFGFGTLENTGVGIQYNMNVYEMTIASFIYFIFFAFVNKGLTIGKSITTVKIKQSNMDEMPLKQIVIRESIKSLLIVISLISFIMVIVRSDKKSIHDLIVDSTVIRNFNTKDLINNNTDPNRVDENFDTVE